MHYFLSFSEKQVRKFDPRFFVKKIAQWPQKRPKQSPNKFYSIQFNFIQFSPKSLGNCFRENNCPMLKTFVQKEFFSSQSFHTDFWQKSDSPLVENVLTKGPGSSYAKYKGKFDKMQSKHVLNECLKKSVICKLSKNKINMLVSVLSIFSWCKEQKYKPSLQVRLAY
jgi:hypothetical protein